MNMSDSREKLNEIGFSHSEEVQDILGYIPGRIIRWGITIIFLIIAGFLVFSWFFKYPDLISAPIIVSNENSPVPVIARVDGRIQKLFVRDDQKMEAGAPLAVLENPADFDHALNLRTQLSQLPADWTATPDALIKTDFPRQLNLGNIQAFYEEFRLGLEEYRLFRQLNYFQSKIDSMRKQKSIFLKIIDNLNRQNLIQEEEFQLLQNHVRRNEDLFKS
ncbi:MAG: biotin/lipoyl-binding protein, partial [Desulfobacteraceae bacterium]